MVIERAELAAQLTNADERIRDVAAGALPLVLVQDHLQTVQQTIDEQPSALPREASMAIRQHLKQMAAWVRQRDFPTRVHDEIAEYLSKRLKKFPVEESHSVLVDWTQLSGQLTSFLEERLPRARAGAAQVIVGGRKVSQRLDVLEEQLKRVPEREQVAAAFKEQGAAESVLKALHAELDALELAEQSEIRRISELTRRREQLFTKVVDAGDAQRTAEYCERSLRTLAEFRSKLVQKRREQLETLILAAFKMLSRKPDLIGSIRLDPDTMMLSLLTDEGELLATQQLSAGERQLLAVAMLWGLARASGRPVPVVIDTPLGRLDGEHRRALVERYFPDASHQVILLSTDQEVDADFSRLLDESVAHRYLIGYSPHERTSSFSQGYFTEVKPDAH
jgi:DNA sulfur modification protein DndD